MDDMPTWVRYLSCTELIKKFPFYLILCSCSACVVLVPKVPGISVKRATRIRRWTGRLSSNVVFCSVLVDDPVLMFIYEK